MSAEVQPAGPRVPVTATTELEARTSGTRTRLLIPGVLGAAAVIALVTWRVWPAPDAPVAEPAAVAAPTTEPAPPAAATASRESVLTTSRPVWLRVMADGKRVIERELPADARVPIPAEETIVIRTGDAGAVRLSLRGVDQGPLGRPGEVVTRTFTLTPVVR